tara:strand:- start:207 stop:719 length:513 start_codon:yes stop_codon:yes gene_type:complete
MKKLVLLLTTLALTPIAACAQSDQTITAVFSGMKFQVPEAPVIVGALGQSNNILLIKYSRSAGKRYISFNTENSLDTGGCDRADFFMAVIGAKPANQCNEAAITSFQSVFRSGSDSGVWKNDERNFYYFLSDDDRSFVFFSSNDGRLIKLESDFLDAKDLRTALGIVEPH